MALPKNTLTHSELLQGNVTSTITTSTPTTVLGFHSLQENVSSNTELKCGDILIYRNFAKDVPYMQLNYVCNDTLWFNKTGQDTAQVVVNYVKYDRASTTEEAIDIEIDVQNVNQFVEYPTSSVQYALAYNASALLFLLFLMAFTASIAAVIYFYKKRF